MEIIVAAWILHEDKLLFIKHKKSGLWLPVGGHVENEEFLEDAIRREVKEEINLEVKSLQPGLSVEQWRAGEIVKGEILPFRIFNKTQKDNRKESFFEYLFEATNPETIKIQEEEIDDYKWLTKKEVQENEIIEPVLKHIALEAFTLRDKIRG